MSTLTRYLRLYRAFARQNLVRELQYRSNWIMVNLNTLAWGLMRIVYYLLAFGAVATVGEWDYARSLVLSGVFMLVHGAHKAFFEGNMQRLVSLIYRGELDFVLTKPVSSQFTCSLRITVPRALIRVILGLIVIAIGIAKSTTPVTVVGGIFLILMCFCGLIIMYTVSFTTITAAFWLGYVEPIANVPQVLTSMTYMPYNIFGRRINTFLTWVLPLMFITTLPTKILFEPNIGTVLAAIIVASASLYASHHFWQLGLKTYSSASS